MNRLEARDVSKRFPAKVDALSGVSFTIASGEFFSIVGPTNAGKSTLLKLISGLQVPSYGRIFLDDVDVTALEPRARGVSLLFQNIALFPTRNGYENLSYPLRLAGWSKDETATRVRDIAALVNVGHLLHRLPATYSGGEQQRVAIGRALAYPTRLLMLDEPLTNLDARLRIALRLAFKSLHRESGQTILYVTHDQVEAMSLSDRILVLNQGRIEQIGTPDDVYHRPRTKFVAEFIGTPPMNILDVAFTNPGELAAPTAAAISVSALDLPEGLAGKNLSVGVRPEDVAAAPGPSESASLPGEVTWIERFGSHQVLEAVVGKQALKVVVPPDHPVCRVGPAWFGLPIHARHWLDRDTGRFIRPGG
jgi:sn-glycerol 3-phosphate transport system ATP-binding protein